MNESWRVASGARTQDAATRVVEVATRQEGVITRRQLGMCGLTDTRIARWIAAGRLHRLHPGVYALGHRSLSERGRLIAALAYGGRGSALSDEVGCWWIGLRDDRPSRIDICSPARMRSLPGVAMHRRQVIGRSFHRGLPVLAIPDLLLQLAHSLPLNATRKALARADFLGLLDPEAVHASLGQGRDGSTALRKALRAHLPALASAQNDFEAEFVLLCERFELPIPEVNARLGRFRPDMLWRDLRLIVELDGKDAHTKPAQVARDRERDLTFRSWGYTVIRYTWAQVRFEPQAVAGDLRMQMGRLGARPIEA